MCVPLWLLSLVPARDCVWVYVYQLSRMSQFRQKANWSFFCNELCVLYGRDARPKTVGRAPPTVYRYSSAESGVARGSLSLERDDQEAASAT